MFVDTVSRLGELVGEQVHQVLHEIALRHEQVLANVSAMSLELVLGEEDVQQLLVGFLMRLLNPLLELVDVEVVLLCLERGLQTDVEDPVLLITASSDEVDGLASLKDFVCEVVRQESGDHHIVQLILFGPQLVVAYIRVCFNKELLERIVYLSCQHPCFDHRQDGSRDFFEDS